MIEKEPITDPLDPRIIRLLNLPVRVTVKVVDYSFLGEDEIAYIHEGILARRTITHYDSKNQVLENGNYVVEFYLANTFDSIKIESSAIKGTMFFIEEL